jgi:hypothetical protein
VVLRCYRLRMTPTPVKTTCTECSGPVTLTTKGKIDSFRSRGRAYCSDLCRDAWVKRDRSERMARTNRAHASARMRARNPMRSPETRAKMSATLREIGHRPRPRSQGGNGRLTPEPQRKLADLLGWPTEFTVIPRDGERPYHYKADIVHPTMKVCIEVDGGSHCPLERQAADRRRDARLASRGWLVFRFSNQAAMERTEECVRTVWSTTSQWTPRIPT